MEAIESTLAYMSEKNSEVEYLTCTSLKQALRQAAHKYAYKIIDNDGSLLASKRCEFISNTMKAIFENYRPD